MTFDREELTGQKLLGLVLALATLCAFARASASARGLRKRGLRPRKGLGSLGTGATAQVAEIFGGTSSTALLFVAICLATGCISRPDVMLSGLGREPGRPSTPTTGTYSSLSVAVVP